MKAVKIAVAVSITGAIRTCGPQDYDEGSHHTAMDAALTWLGEAGEIVGATYWVTTELANPVREVRGSAHPTQKEP